MEFVILKKLENIYQVDHDYKSSIQNLANFLTDDCRSNTESFKEWLDDPEYLETSGNISWLEKWGDNIIIGFLFYDFEEDKYKDVFTISKGELIKVLDKWKELIGQMPNYIKIINNNGKITMEGRKQAEDIEYLKLQLNNNKYSIIETSKTKIKFFGVFLTGDFQTNPKKFLNTINDFNIYKGISSTIRKSKYEVLINELTIESKIVSGYDNTFFIKKNHFIETLNKLHELFNQKVKEIGITYKDDIYTIEAID